MDVLGLGEYIRRQREGSRLSLRKLSGLTGVSGSYLSQVERGLRKPSAEILQGIAKGLRISAETLYVQAGILEDRPVTDVVSAIVSDPAINERQKQALVQIYEAFRDDAARVAPPSATPAPKATRTTRATRATKSGSSKKSSPKARTAGARTTSKAVAATEPRHPSRATARTSKEA